VTWFTRTAHRAQKVPGLARVSGVADEKFVKDRCGVTTREGKPCPNSTTGVLFGCGQARGHLWAKFFTRFG
jgi:hypothetical protein